MKYAGMPMGMWALFHRSFRERMVSVFGTNEAEAKETERKAKQRYKEITVTAAIKRRCGHEISH